MIKYLGVGTQEIPTPQQVSSWESMRWWQKNLHLTDLESNHNPIGATIRVPYRSDIGFGYSSGYPSKSTSDKPINHISTVPTIKPYSAPSKNPTKYPV